MAVVREDRDRLALLLSDFMEEKIGSFALDKGLDDLLESKDSAVRELAGQLWFFYDDFADHTIIIDRDGWNWLQRWLLFLKTDEAKPWPQDPTPSTSRWWLAVRFAAVLAGVILSAWALALAMQSYVGISIWLAGTTLAIWFGRRSSGGSALDPVKQEIERCLPFRTSADILRARRLCATFRKKSWPSRLHGKTIRPAWMSFIMGLPAFLLLWPLVVLGTICNRQRRPKSVRAG